jgi:hypothetical protein
MPKKPSSPLYISKQTQKGNKYLKIIKIEGNKELLLSSFETF